MEARLRYWLRIPPYQRRQAIHAGCVYDPTRQQWYVKEPLRPGFLLSDFEAWKATAEDTIEARQAIARYKKSLGGSSLR